MTGLVLKLSYNYPGETPVTGGICGSYFFVGKDVVVTANHVLNKNAFKPNEGYKYCQFWLISEPTIIIELSKDDLIDYPDVDLTVIKLRNSYNVAIRRLSSEPYQKGVNCYNEGFIANQMPGIVAEWRDEKLIINSCLYNSTAIT